MADDETTGETKKSGGAGPRGAGRAAQPKAAVVAAKAAAKAGPAAKAKPAAKSGPAAKAGKAKPAKAAKPGKPAKAAKSEKAAAAAEQPGTAMTAPLRLKDLIEEVSTLTGSRKRDVKPVVEATLAALGQALAADRVLALPTFGKARVNRHRDTGSGETLTIKLRRHEAGKAGAGKAGAGKAKEGLAAADE